MFDNIKNLIKSKSFELKDMLNKINTVWLESMITDEQMKELKELAYKTITLQTKQIDSKILKETILKELNITKDNLEYYIEEFLDKIIVEDKVKSGLEIRLFGNYTIKYDLTKEG